MIRINHRLSIFISSIFSRLYKKYPVNRTYLGKKYAPVDAPSRSLYPHYLQLPDVDEMYTLSSISRESLELFKAMFCASGGVGIELALL